MTTPATTATRLEPIPPLVARRPTGPRAAGRRPGSVTPSSARRPYAVVAGPVERTRAAVCAADIVAAAPTAGPAPDVAAASAPVPGAAVSWAAAAAVPDAVSRPDGAPAVAAPSPRPAA